MFTVSCARRVVVLLNVNGPTIALHTFGILLNVANWLAVAIPPWPFVCQLCFPTSGRYPGETKNSAYPNCVARVAGYLRTTFPLTLCGPCVILPENGFT